MEYRIVPNKDDVAARPERMIGRCEMFDEIACGGMATIHLGRMLGAGGFTRTVAIKRLHAQYAKDPEFVNMFLDEARIVARIRHPNVVPTLDLVDEEGELYIIMEYVEGINFGDLLRTSRKRRERVPLGVALRIVVGALHGLHAAHEATDEQGQPLCLVHRDVSPDNFLVGVDGFARVLDFGVARAMGRLSTTRDGHVKGKLSYMAPEQVLGDEVDRRTDVFSASSVLWQALTGKRLFKAKQLVELTHKILNMDVPKPSSLAASIPKKFDQIVLKGLERDADKRWPTTLAMAEALEAVGHLASHREVGLWVRKLGSTRLGQLATKVSALERKPVTKQRRSARRVELRSKLAVSQLEVRDGVPRIRQSVSHASLSELGEPRRPPPPSADDSQELLAASVPSPDDSAEHDLLESGEIPLSSQEFEVRPAVALPQPPPATEDRKRSSSLAGLVLAKLPAAVTERPLLWGGGAAAALLGIVLLLALVASLGADDDDEAAAQAATRATAAATAVPNVTQEPAPPETATPSAEPTSEPEPTAEPEASAEPDATAEPEASAEPAPQQPKQPVSSGTRPRPGTRRPRPKGKGSSLYSRQ